MLVAKMGGSEGMVISASQRKGGAITVRVRTPLPRTAARGAGGGEIQYVSAGASLYVTVRLTSFRTSAAPPPMFCKVGAMTVKMKWS